MKPIKIDRDILPVGEFKTHASRYLRQLRESGQPMIITQYGKPVAVLITPGDYDRFNQTSREARALERGEEPGRAGPLMLVERVPFTGHSLLTLQGIWSIQGIFWDEHGRPADLAGVLRVAHQKQLWRLDARMKVEIEPSQSIRHRLEIVPFTPGSTSTVWSGKHVMLGAFEGTLVVWDRSLLMTYKSEDGQLTGMSRFRWMSPTLYAARSALFLRGRVIESWAAEFRRQTF